VKVLESFSVKKNFWGKRRF